MYLSGSTPRWTPSSEADLREALTNGVLEETHYLELKREISAGKGANKELARDLAQFAIDGGTLIVGIEEHDDVPPTLAPVPLAGLPERIEQIARSIPDPPLAVSCRVIPSESDPTEGYVLVSVGASGTAPHMVDGAYYGRGDKMKVRLSDPEVLRYHQARGDVEEAAGARLDEYVRRDPVPTDLRKQAHFFVIAAPVAPRREMLLDAVHGDNWAERFVKLRDAGLEFNGNFAPDLDEATTFARRAGGAAMTTYGLTSDRQLRSEGERFREDVVELELSEDGEVRLLMTRLSDHLREGGDQMILADVIPVLTLRAVRIASAVATHCGYLGPWMLGVAATGVAGLGAYQSRMGMYDHSPRLGRDFDDYRAVTTASTAGLAQLPGTVTNRLTGRLLRALGVAEQFSSLLADPEVSAGQPAPS